ncbi:MAG: cysteine desulfurase [Pseudomonadaceae bacterium]|nr:cysteine desulfurase [Pseudomonadaceae bacterium]
MTPQAGVKKQGGRLVSRMGDVWRQDFQSLMRADGGAARLAFLDNAASAHKPEAVLEAIANALEGPYANIHRGLYRNSAEMTRRYEEARQVVAEFLGAPVGGIVFTRNATEAVNLVAASWGRANLKAGDAVLLSELEHHANIVPWQLLRDAVGIEIRVAGIDEHGALDMADVEAHLADGNVGLVALTQMSNVLGVQPDVAKVVKLAHLAGAKVLVDGSQGAVHGPQNMKQLGADFYVCTGHKLYGPTGIGVLASTPELLNAMPPYQGGGDMIESVTWDKTTYAPAPARFEAGTPAFVEAMGLAAAIQYVQGLGWKDIQKHESEMATYLDNALDAAMVLRYGMAGRGHGIAAFNVPKCHPHDVATVLDQHNVAVRSGHHCAMPLMAKLGIDGCLRASIGLYTVKEDIDQLVEGLHKAAKLLRR